tara:strand:+ start:2904 stop:3350 length:447 start_codon:yes stop_codon:yes gene_type:complete
MIKFHKLAVYASLIICASISHAEGTEFEIIQVDQSPIQHCELESAEALELNANHEFYISLSAEFTDEKTLTRKARHRVKLRTKKLCREHGYKHWINDSCKKSKFQSLKLKIGRTVLGDKFAVRNDDISASGVHFGVKAEALTYCVNLI